MKIIAVYSNKGGVGKTSTAVNLAYLAARNKYNTLICDLDPQSSATFYFRVKPRLKTGIENYFNKKKIDKNIKATDYDRLEILPADFVLKDMDAMLLDYNKPDSKLLNLFESLKEDYDLVVIDCPPTINIVADNIFNLANIILVPIIPTTLSIRTHYQLIDYFNDMDYQRRKIVGFFSMYDKRKKLHNELISKARNEFKQMMKSVIPYVSKIEKMGISREPVLVTSPRSVASRAYKDLWNELESKYL